MIADKEGFLTYWFRGETHYTITYIKIINISSQYLVNSKDFRVPLDESLMEGMCSEDKVIKNMTFEILKNKYER